MPTTARAKKVTASLALSAALIGTAMLSGCSGQSSSSSAAKPTATLQLGWIANVENLGPYVAQRDHDFGDVNVKINPGGPNTSVGPLVASGKALVGLGSTDEIARANAQGASLVIVGATLQDNPTAVMSLASKPIKTLADLKGKRLCIQTSGIPIMDGVLEANHIDKSSITYVPAQFDPSPLVAGDCDAFLAALGNQAVTLKLQGIETTSFKLADYGYHIWGDTLYTTKAALADKEKRAEVKAIVAGTIKGWNTAIKDTKPAVEYVVNGPGKNQNLDLKQQELSAQAFISIIQTPETKKDGLLSMSTTGIQENIATLKREGITGDLNGLFDTSILKEIGSE